MPTQQTQRPASRVLHRRLVSVSPNLVAGDEPAARSTGGRKRTTNNAKPPESEPAQRFKDRYWFKTIKWYLYKKRYGKPSWAARYIFDGLARRLCADDLVIDCGANVGRFTRMMAAKGATLHAFEPDPYAFSRLCESTAHLPSVIRHNQAVGVGKGTVKLFRSPSFDEAPEEASISSSVFADKVNVDEEKYVEVEQIDFASFLRNLERPVRLLKVDIEGAEVPLLEHLIENGLLEKADFTFVETHETRIPALAERTAELRKTAQRDFPGKLYLDWE